MCTCVFYARVVSVNRRPEPTGCNSIRVQKAETLIHLFEGTRLATATRLAGCRVAGARQLLAGHPLGMREQILRLP